MQQLKEDGEEEKKTIEFHTDQGFFIAFTPGMIVSPTATKQEEPLLSNGFYIQDTTTNSGKQMHLIFTEKD
jgi:hypothetical protein